jgi:hypothetical protein
MGVEPTRPDRRKAFRLLIDIEAELVLSDSCGRRILTGKIIDISKSGLGLHTGQFLAPGLRLQVNWPSTSASCVVRHCRQLQDGRFVSGLEIEGREQFDQLRHTDHLSLISACLFLVGTLSTNDMDSAQAHVRDCSNCRQLLAMADDLLVSTEIEWPGVGTERRCDATSTSG